MYYPHISLFIGLRTPNPPRPVGYPSRMRVLVTGALGKVGRTAIPTLQAAGHDVTASDLPPVGFDRQPPGTASYVGADLTDAGQVFSLVGGISAGENEKSGRYDAVVHAGAIPGPGKHAPHVLFHNNIQGAFNVVEACVRWGVPRLVNISSEAATGVAFSERVTYPVYLPVDEDHPTNPQDPYALAKIFAEQMCDAAVARSHLRVLTIRPSWVQDATSYAVNLGPMVADEQAPSVTGWAYTDAYDLADAITQAVCSNVAGHEIVYIAADDTVGGRDLHASWRRAFPEAPTELRPVPRPDASGITTEKAKRLLDWTPQRTWADYLDDAGSARRVL